MPPPSPHTPAGVVLCLSISLIAFARVLLAIFLTAAFAMPALAGPFEDAVAKFANDDFSDTDEAIGAVAASGNPLAFSIISALQEGRLSADPESKKVFVTGADGKIIDAATGAAVDKLPGWRRCRPPQQPPAPHRGSRARRPDAAVARSRQADRRRAVGVQEPRRECACRRSTVRWPRKPTRPPRRPSPRPAPPSCFTSRTRPRSRSSKPSPSSRRKGDQEAMALLTGLRQRRAAQRRARRDQRDRLDPEQSCDVVDGAERLVRPVARLRAAARRDRACDHLRRHGRHQHGPWRDGDDRRLHHLRGAGGHPHPLSRHCSTTRC